MKGRKPKPTALKKMQGNPGKRPLNELEPIPRGKELKCPESLNPIAKEIWKYLYDELEFMGILTTADLFSLRALCNIEAQIISLEKDIQEEGTVLKYQRMDSLGNEFFETKMNPKATRLDRLYSEARYYRGLFGLEPASRARFKTDKSPEK